jgi:hypothetical protein
MALIYSIGKFAAAAKGAYDQAHKKYPQFLLEYSSRLFCRIYGTAEAVPFQNID